MSAFKEILSSKFLFLWIVQFFKRILLDEVSDPARERLLSFYSQFGQCQNLLQDDMDRFIQVIQEQPPIKFVTLSKQILKRSNELVYLGK